MVELHTQDKSYRASFQYETVKIAEDRAPTPADALRQLVQFLQAKGYSQLRSRLSFRGEAYLGSQEPWVEYPDPKRPFQFLTGLVEFLRRVVGKPQG